jgi:hypothetical protein
MSFDEQLTGRVRTALGGRRDLIEERMFGGLAFMYRGHLVCGVIDDELIAHVGPVHFNNALTHEGARPLVYEGRAMKGMVVVGKEGIRTRPRLKRWVLDSLAYVSSMAGKRG